MGLVKGLGLQQLHWGAGCTSQAFMKLRPRPTAQKGCVSLSSLWTSWCNGCFSGLPISPLSSSPACCSKQGINSAPQQAGKETSGRRRHCPPCLGTFREKQSISTMQPGRQLCFQTLKQLATMQPAPSPTQIDKPFVLLSGFSVYQCSLELIQPVQLA